MLDGFCPTNITATHSMRGIQIVFKISKKFERLNLSLDAESFYLKLNTGRIVKDSLGFQEWKTSVGPTKQKANLVRRHGPQHRKIRENMRNYVNIPRNKNKVSAFIQYSKKHKSKLLDRYRKMRTCYSSKARQQWNFQTSIGTVSAQKIMVFQIK